MVKTEIKDGKYGSSRKDKSKRISLQSLFRIAFTGATSPWPLCCKNHT